MEETNDPLLHVLTNFRLRIPVAGRADSFVFTQITSPSFGLTLTRTDTHESYHYQIQMLQSNGVSEDLITNGLVWAKRTPFKFQTNQNTPIIEGLLCRLKINAGVFDFRRNKDRSIRFVVRCFSNDVLLNTGFSQTCRVLPKRRVADEEAEDSAIIQICWPLDAGDQNKPVLLPQNDAVYASPEEYCDEDSVMADFNDSEERLQSYSNEGDSEDLALVPISQASYATTELRQYIENDYSNEYIVLYNGNAEVIGNFRALNFYKASDINIKEDVRLLIDDRDPRSVLLKIDGVEYKFKQGATNALLNRRFVGYIAQQIESVVPEAVQLIDGILHVDYESLIPYLSESIKQNFRDISDMKANTSQIHQVVDMMYAEFIKKEQNSIQKSALPNSRNRSLRWIIGTSLAVLLLISVAIGVFFIVPFVHTPPSSDNRRPDSDALTPLAPAPATSKDQDVLQEFFYDTDGPNWQNGASAFVSVCKWPGVYCDSDLRVIEIAMDNDKMIGTIPNSIGRLSKLRKLYLASQHLYGTIPKSIGDITSLAKLSFRRTLLHGSVPLEIFSLPSLNTLYLGLNQQLSWTMPTQIGNLKNLTELNIYRSGLQGTLPNEISQLTNLTRLHLGYNNLTGTIPSLAKTNVVRLEIGGNQLSGTIPKLNEALVSPENVYIALQVNYFSGELDLPEEFVQNLVVLDISENNFTSVSSKFNKVPPLLKQCNASDNLFKCPIPGWLKAICEATCTVPV